VPTKDLEHVLLSEEILSLHRAQASGIVEVCSKTISKNLYLQSGRIVFASSSDEQDRLGEQLIRLGRISRAEFAAVYRHSREHQQRLGETLVDAGLVDGDELGALVARQVQKIVLSLFRWTNGMLRFEEKNEPITADLKVDLSLRRLLFEGMRAFPDAVRLERALGNPEQRLRVTAQPPFDIGRVALSPVERDIIADASSELRISDVFARSAARSLLVQGLYALLVGGIVERREADVAPNLSVIEGDTETFQLAMTDTHPPFLSEEAARSDLRATILKRYESLPRATHYDILGVVRTASHEEIDAAYRSLTREQDEEWSELANDAQMGSIISTLRLRRREAYLALSDHNRRVAYDRSLESNGGPRSVEVTAEAHGRALRLSREAKSALERGDRDNAVTMLLEGVDLDPHDNTCRRLLALMLAQHPTLARRAERHFLTALDLNPGDVDLRFRLALYYKKLGLSARAIVQLKAVLGAHPAHDEARRELNALELLSTRRSR
jgi:tetratricopeptide (TPR) repeat protein